MLDDSNEFLSILEGLFDLNKLLVDIQLLLLLVLRLNLLFRLGSLFHPRKNWSVLKDSATKEKTVTFMVIV